MAQNLLKFETENDYRIAKINHLIVPHICYVKESGKSYISSVMSNRVDAVSGDIIAFNNADNTMAFIKPEAYTMEIATKYTPVAVVVIPQTHTSDNKVVGVSLKAMSTTSPVNGSVDTNGIVWGRGIDVINKHDYIVCINIEDNNNPSATLPTQQCLICQVINFLMAKHLLITLLTFILNGMKQLALIRHRHTL